mmetsp:Transcript_97479/g.257374  ORF Transcript_97479/g.257374 Transcript_97479/m.257374 type:complete len:266 (+) Transcript_97479:1211-2008(+)
MVPPPGTLHCLGERGCRGRSCGCLPRRRRQGGDRGEGAGWVACDTAAGGQVYGERLRRQGALQRRQPGRRPREGREPPPREPGPVRVQRAPDVERRPPGDSRGARGDLRGRLGLPLPHRRGVDTRPPVPREGARAGGAAPAPQGASEQRAAHRGPAPGRPLLHPDAPAQGRVRRPMLPLRPDAHHGAVRGGRHDRHRLHGDVEPGLPRVERGERQGLPHQVGGPLLRARGGTRRGPTAELQPHRRAHEEALLRALRALRLRLQAC